LTQQLIDVQAQMQLSQIHLERVEYPTASVQDRVDQGPAGPFSLNISDGNPMHPASFLKEQVPLGAVARHQFHQRKAMNETRQKM
jgi:hypothetical protein